MSLVVLAVGFAVPGLEAKISLFVFGGFLLVLVALAKSKQAREQDERARQLADKVDDIHGMIVGGAEARHIESNLQPQIIPKAEFRQGYLDDEYQIVFGRDERLMRPNSFLLLATFRNEPTEEHPSRPVKSLSASIIYHNNNPAGTGFWLRSTKPTVDLDIGCEQSVALIYAVPPTLSDDGSAFMIIDERQAATGKLAYVAFPHSLSNSAAPEQSTDTVGLTVAESGRVLGTATYQMRYGSGDPAVMSVDWQPIKSNVLEHSDVILEQLVEEAELNRERNRLKTIDDKQQSSRGAALYDDSVAIAALNAHTAALRDAAMQARIDEIQKLALSYARLGVEERGFDVTCDNPRLDHPRSETYRIRVSNRGVSTIDDVRIRVMSITGAPELSGVLPISLREQHGKEAPFTLNNASLFIDLLEWSQELMPGVIVSYADTDGQHVQRRVQYAFLCNDSSSPRVRVDCSEGTVHQIEVEVQGRNVPTCLKTFRVRSLLPERGPDGAGLEVTEV